jgi:hypothetical protein
MNNLWLNEREREKKNTYIQTGTANFCQIENIQNFLINADKIQRNKKTDHNKNNFVFSFSNIEH